MKLNTLFLAGISSFKLFHQHDIIGTHDKFVVKCIKICLAPDNNSAALFELCKNIFAVLVGKILYGNRTRVVGKANSGYALFLALFVLYLLFGIVKNIAPDNNSVSGFIYIADVGNAVGINALSLDYLSAVAHYGDILEINGDCLRSLFHICGTCRNVRVGNGQRIGIDLLHHLLIMVVIILLCLLFDKLYGKFYGKFLIQQLCKSIFKASP